jgi:acetyltransferase-like isoleucine patch superfamily enzyme
MRKNVEIVCDEYRDVEYRDFDPPAGIRRAMKAVGWISLPFIVYPLVLLAKFSPEAGFKMASEILSLLPSTLGASIRYEFYRRTLRSCGKNVLIYAGAVFYYPEVNIGDNVGIDSHVRIQHCDLGNNVGIGAGTQILSGSKIRNFSRTDIPILTQGGKMKRTRIGNDVYIGVNCIIMDDVGDGAVVAAGSVVINKVEPYSIVGGNPARLIKKRISQERPSGGK